MKQRLLWILVFILIVSVSLFILLHQLPIEKNFSKDKDFLTWLTKSAQQQPSTKQQFQQVQLIHHVILDTSNTALYHPYNFQVDSQNHYYILDWATQQIKKYDSFGSYLFSFGKGKGTGPKFFNNITDYKIFSSYLYIMDPTQGKMEVYNKETGKYLYSNKFEIPIYKFAVISDSLFIGKPVVNTQFFLGLFQNQQLMSKILSRFTYSKKTTLVSDSHLFTVGNNIIIIFNMGGFFFRYDLSKKKVKYIKQTVLPIEFPEVEQPNPYVMKISSKRKFSALNASVSRNLIMLFSQKTTQYSIADFYSLENGDYQFSIKLNKKYTDLQFRDKYIFALTQNAVDNYEIKIPLH